MEATRKVKMNSQQEAGRLQTSEKQIVETLAEPFDSKIAEIRKHFTGETKEEIYILEKFRPRHAEEFNFAKNDRMKMYETIRNAENSKSTAYNDISLDCLKQISNLMLQILTHLFNRILETKMFPEGLKIARVLPLKMNEKCKLQKYSYCPISRLNPIENFIKEIFKLFTLYMISTMAGG